MTDVEHVEAAVRLAVASAANVGGGPFGAVVADAEGVVVATGTNAVVATCDPTAHAEVVALRSAATALGRADLRGCVLYASCYPCPMCLVAAWWARVDRVAYAAEAEAAAAAGFDDRRFWDAVGGGDDAGSIAPVVQVHVPSALEPFDAWRANPDRVEY